MVKSLALFIVNVFVIITKSWILGHLWQKCLETLRVIKTTASAITSSKILKIIWDKVFKNEPSKICGRQPLKDLKQYGLLKQSLESFSRLSSTNFTCSILKYFVPYGNHTLSFFKFIRYVSEDSRSKTNLSA